MSNNLWVRQRYRSPKCSTASMTDYYEAFLTSTSNFPGHIQSTIIDTSSKCVLTCEYNNKKKSKKILWVKFFSSLLLYPRDHMDSGLTCLYLAKVTPAKLNTVTKKGRNALYSRDYKKVKICDKKIYGFVFSYTRQNLLFTLYHWFKDLPPSTQITCPVT